MPMIERPMNNVNTADAQAKEGVTVVGNPDRWCLLSKASADGWMKSTKAMSVEGGALVQVSTLQRNPDGGYTAAEGIAYVPDVKIVDDVNGGHKLVKR
jgi:hypothetical protein